MFRGFLFPLLGVFLAARSASGRHSRLMSAGLAMLAARLGGARPLGLAALLLGFLLQGRRGAASRAVAAPRWDGRRGA